MIKLQSYDNFISNLDSVTSKLISKRVAKLDKKQFGNCQSIGTCNDGKVKRRLYEMTVDNGPGYRVYWCQNGDQICCLTAGTKKTQKRDIDIAKNLITTTL